MECEKFWLECPLSLFESFDIIPEKSMCTNSKLNAATRLAILISIVLYFAKIKEWYLFLGGALTLIILSKYVFCSGTKEGYKEIPTLTPVWFHKEPITPVEQLDAICNADFEMVEDEVDDVEYVDDEYQPRRHLGISNMMPDEEELPDHMDRRQLQQLNTSRYADRIVAAREDVVKFFKKEMQERFEPDEYYEGY